MVIFFWTSLFLIFYTFIGYGLLLYCIIRLKRAFAPRPVFPRHYEALPTVTVVVAAYNEQDIIEKKIINTLSLSYPVDKIEYLFITDGSTDNTADIVGRYKNVRLMHSAARLGKVNAMHRAMQTINSSVVIFTDANTFLNKEALLLIGVHYADPSVGAVAGEKRVQVLESSDATAGEGFYWKYESKLKQWDYELFSVVGAAGELFSIRTSLYVPVATDTILDDFMISLKIAARGFRIAYEPLASATETGSENTKEELKRKIRIAAGGIQSILRLKELLNPFRHPLLTFQYISHRVLRWTITPFLMILVLAVNMFLCYRGASIIYVMILAGQCFFYLLAFGGWLVARMQLKMKLLFIPFYFCMMNYAVISGIGRYIRGGQDVAWEKARRK